MGWLDLINIGIDAAQSYQIYQARERLRQIETGALTEALRKEVLEVLRNFVFATAQNLKELEQHLENSPQPAYVAARALEWRFQDIGISPEIFPEFTDKEYVLNVQEKLAEIIQDSQSRLTPDQISQGQECIKAIVQMSLLDQAVDMQVAREHLQSTEAEWKKVAGDRSKFTMGGLAALGAAFFVCPVAYCFSTFALAALVSSAGGSSQGSILGLVTIVVNGALFLASLVGGIILLAKRRNPRHQELKKAREQWRDKIPDQETREQIVRLLGEQSSDEYQRLRATRAGLVREVMGQIEGYDRLLASPGEHLSL